MGRRILITYPFPLGRATGGARMTREIARHLGMAGSRVTVIAVSANFKRGVYPRPEPEREALGYEFDEELAHDSVDIQRVPQHRLHWALDAKGVRDLVALELERGPVDAVLSYYKEAAFLPALLKRHPTKFGYISTWQSYARALQTRAGGVPRWMTKMVNKKLVLRPHQAADIFFATSGFTRDELVQYLAIPRERIFVCPLGVQPHFFDIPSEEPEEVENFLFFGRIIPAKGVADALRAFAALRTEGRPFRFRIVGQGWHDWARNLAKELGIESSVEVHGPADDEGLRAHLQWAHVAVLPSHFEAFGLAFAEAQAAGLPVVAYKAGSVPEVVLDGETGWLAPAEDVDALGRCLEEAHRGPEEVGRRGRAARERVKREFTWQRTAETILGGLDRVCGESSSKAV